MAAYWAIIVAGGSGSRMQSVIPKQFLTIDDIPILVRTLHAFWDYNPEINLIVVLPDNEHARWQEIKQAYDVRIPHTVVSGGKTRFQSVKNGLSAIEGDEGLVAIHDGVRPFVSPELIQKCYEAAQQTGSGVAAVHLKESIREMVSITESISRDRTKYRLIQTPQTFQVSFIKNAFKLEEQDYFTDDASVYEADGGKISLVEGSYENRKITTPEDLIWAEAFLSNKK